MAGPADTAAPAAAEPTLLDVLVADSANVLDAQLPPDIRPLFVALVDRLGSAMPKLLEGKTSATEAAEAEATPGSPAAVPPAPGGEPVPIENTPPALAEPQPPTPAGEPVPITGDDELAEASELEQLRARNAELEQLAANAAANANPPAVTSSPGEPAAPAEGAPA